MVCEPGLPIAPPNPTTPQEVKTGKDDSDRTDDAEGMPRFTETAGLPNTEPGDNSTTNDTVSDLNENFHIFSVAYTQKKQKKKYAISVGSGVRFSKFQIGEKHGCPVRAS